MSIQCGLCNPSSSFHISNVHAWQHTFVLPSETLNYFVPAMSGCSSELVLNLAKTVEERSVMAVTLSAV